MNGGEMVRIGVAIPTYNRRNYLEKLINDFPKEIKEEGSHQELLALGGIYYNIYQKQLLEEEIEEL